MVVIVVMASVAVPLLVRVTAWAALLVPTCWLANVRVVLDKVTAGAIPVPLRLTVCGLPAPLSVMDTVPVRVPVVVGVKVTLMVQLAEAANDAPQVLVST